MLYDNLFRAFRTFAIIVIAIAAIGAVHEFLKTQENMRMYTCDGYAFNQSQAPEYCNP